MRDEEVESGIPDEVYSSSMYYEKDIYAFSQTRNHSLPDLEDDEYNFYPRANVTNLYAYASSDEVYAPPPYDQMGKQWDPINGQQPSHDYLCDDHYVRCKLKKQVDEYDGQPYSLCEQVEYTGDANDTEFWGDNECYSLSSFGTLDSCANQNLEEINGPDGITYGPKMCLQSYATGALASQMVYYEQDVQQCWCKQETFRISTRFLTEGVGEIYEQLKAFMCIGATFTWAGEILPWKDTCNPQEHMGSKVCWVMAKAIILANALGVVVAIIIAVINILLKPLLVLLATSERNLSVTDERKSVVTSFYAFQLVNLIIIKVLVAMSLKDIGVGEWVVSVSGDLNIRLLNGMFEEFSHEWYITEGTAVFVAMIAQVIVPHVEPTIKDIIVPTLKRNFLAKGAATQAAMNELYEAGEFEVHTRYAFVMVHLTVALAYGGGLPHLYLLATLNFAIAFQIDKAFLLKVNNKPPQYDAELARVFCNLLTAVVFIHFFMTGYMFSNETIMRSATWPWLGIFDKYGHFQSTNTLPHPLVVNLLERYLSRANVFPLMFLLGSYIALVAVIKTIGRPLIPVAQRVLVRIGFESIAPKLTITKMVPGLTKLYRHECTPEQRAAFQLDARKREKGEANVAPPGEALPEKDVKRGLRTFDGRVCFAVWTEDVDENHNLYRGIKKKKGERMRTWEVIQQDGLFNYKMKENPKYRTVSLMFEEAGLQEHDDAPTARSPSKQLSLPGASAKIAPEEGAAMAASAAAASEAMKVVDLEAGGAAPAAAAAPAPAEEAAPAAAEAAPAAAEAAAPAPAEAKPAEAAATEAKPAEAAAEAKPAGAAKSNDGFDPGAAIAKGLTEAAEGVEGVAVEVGAGVVGVGLAVAEAASN